MTLSFKEKRELTKIVTGKTTEIQNGGLSFKEKRAATKALNDAVVKLNGKIDSMDKKGADTPPALQDLIDGKFNDLTPVQFIAKLEEINKELDSVDPLKEPTLNYIEAKQEQGVLESADMEALQAFGRGMGQEKPQQGHGSAVRVMPIAGPGQRNPKAITIDIDGNFTEPETFREIIHTIEQATPGDEITLKINSPGGRTDSAQAVYVALLETAAKTIAKIINAASSGSIVAMACDEIQTTPFCTMMIHNASGGTRGKMGDMRAQTTYHENHFRKWFGQLYAGYLSNEEIDDLMKGQDFWHEEDEIKKRLENWKPLRERLQEDGSVVEA
jgi:ATP-dependent protease ClpP protease subunit